MRTLMLLGVAALSWGAGSGAALNTLDPPIPVLEAPAGEGDDNSTVPPPGSPSTERRPLRLFLHAKGTAPGCSDLTLNATDAAGDADRCGSSDPRLPAPFSEPDVFSYAAAEKVNGSVREGFRASYSVFVATDGPDEVALLATLHVGAASCSHAPAAQRRVHGDWGVFQGECIFRGASKPDDLPRLRITVDRRVSAYLGHEGDHSSEVTLEFEPREEPANAQTRRARPTQGMDDEEGGAAPAAHPLAGLAAVAGILAWGRRLRGPR